MLPGPKSQRPSLADVLQSCLGAVSGAPNRFALPRAKNAIVVLIDGLGAELLAERAGHARTMSAAMVGRWSIDSGFPTTTASALTTLATGKDPGQHGMVGYSVLDAANDRLVNLLSGWDDRIDPTLWQVQPTLFETAAAAGLRPLVIGPGRYSSSGFTQAVLRGARYLAEASIADRMNRAAAEVDGPGAGLLVYLYVPELDSAAHAHGWQSAEWTVALEQTDASLRELVRAVGVDTGLVVTADHGMLDVPRDAHVLVDGASGVLDGIRFIGGEPRCLQLYFEPDATPTRRAALLERWRGAESSRSKVVTREEAIDQGWFGAVRAEVAPRIGDILVAASKNIAYYDVSSGDPKARGMIAQHGSWSAAEMRIPFLRFGAFAR